MDYIKNNVVVSVVVSVLVVLVAFYLFGGSTVVNNTVERVSDAIGAVPGNVVDSRNFSIGGVDTYNERQAMAATSTSICVFKNPYTATSTLVRFTAGITGNLTKAEQTFDLSTTSANGGFGSSSPALATRFSTLERSLVWTPGNATTTAGDTKVMASFNSSTGASNIVIRPNEYVTLRMATSSGMATVAHGTNSVTGSCSAVFQKLFDN